MTRSILRHYVGRCQYAGRDPFLLGTVQAESELDALRKLEAAWSRISPDRPPLIAPLPGLLAFREESE